MDDREAIFNRLRPLLARYAPPLVARTDLQGRYDLWSEKDVVIEGRKRSEVSFAALIVQSTFVGFYFMPVYTEPETAEFFAPNLRAILKGKSCFHVKKLDDSLFAAIDDALEKGWALYKKRGWV